MKFYFCVSVTVLSMISLNDHRHLFLFLFKGGGVQFVNGSFDLNIICHPEQQATVISLLDVKD